MLYKSYLTELNWTIPEQRPHNSLSKFYDSGHSDWRLMGGSSHPKCAARAAPQGRLCRAAAAVLCAAATPTSPKGYVLYKMSYYPTYFLWFWTSSSLRGFCLRGLSILGFWSIQWSISRAVICPTSPMNLWATYEPRLAKNPILNNPLKQNPLCQLQEQPGEVQ